MNNNQGQGARPDQSAQHAATVSEQHPHGGPEGGRKEVGTAADSQRHPPHVTENESGAPVQAEHESPNEVPTLPANSSGTDKVSTDDQWRSVDDESMYDRRPAEDKEQPPSK